MENTQAAVAFASGMAAITACLLAAAAEGKRHVVAVRPLYGGSDHLLASGLLGTEVTWAAADGIAAARRPDTGLVILETPANPTLELLDLARVAEQCGGVPLLVDNTFATPVLQNPADFGATLVVHSATKYLGGHGDVLAGVVATTDGVGRAAATDPRHHRLGPAPAVLLPAAPRPADAPAARPSPVAERAEAGRPPVGQPGGGSRLLPGPGRIATRSTWSDGR